ncbi:hypothetical protein ES703_106006 [subsurface metagenome]
MPNENKNNEKKRFGRRAGAGIVFAVLVVEIWHVVAFKNLALDYFEVPAKILFGALIVVVSGLTLTDLLLKKAKGKK